MHERLKEVVDDLLKPLLQRDDSDIELLSVEEDIVTIEVHGRAAYGAGAALVRDEIIMPALEKAAGQQIDLRVKRAVPKPRAKKKETP